MFIVEKLPLKHAKEFSKLMYKHIFMEKGHEIIIHKKYLKKFVYRSQILYNQLNGDLKIKLTQV